MTATSSDSFSDKELGNSCCHIFHLFSYEK